MTTVSTKTPANDRNPNIAATHGKSFDSFTESDLYDIVQRNANRVIKDGSVQREANNLNRHKLFSACAAEVKSLAGQDKLNRIPSGLATMLDKVIDKFIDELIAKWVNHSNSVSATKSFGHDFPNLRVVERVVIRGTNTLSLDAQKWGIRILIRKAKERLESLRDRQTPDYEAEAKVQQTIDKMELTEKHIVAEIEKQKEVKPNA